MVVKARFHRHLSALESASSHSTLSRTPVGTPVQYTSTAQVEMKPLPLLCTLQQEFGAGLRLHSRKAGFGDFSPLI